MGAKNANKPQILDEQSSLNFWCELSSPIHISTALCVVVVEMTKGVVMRRRRREEERVSIAMGKERANESSECGWCGLEGTWKA
jgi:hypothetical protein